MPPALTGVRQPTLPPLPVVGRFLCRLHPQGQGGTQPHPIGGSLKQDREIEAHTCRPVDWSPRSPPFGKHLPATESIQSTPLQVRLDPTADHSTLETQVPEYSIRLAIPRPSTSMISPLPACAGGRSAPARSRRGRERPDRQLPLRRSFRFCEAGLLARRKRVILTQRVGFQRVERPKTGLGSIPNGDRHRPVQLDNSPMRSRRRSDAIWGSHFGPVNWAFGGGEGTRTLGLYIAKVVQPNFG